MEYRLKYVKILYIVHFLSFNVRVGGSNEFQWLIKISLSALMHALGIETPTQIQSFKAINYTYVKHFFFSYKP